MQLRVGDGLAVTVHELGDGDGDGPTLAVLAGVHGDEYEGQVAARLLLAALRDVPVRGRLLLVPASNPAAVRAGTRTSPDDGRNLAREFPGSADGTLTQRVAHALTEHVIAGASLLVDLHSAGVEMAMPLFAGYHENQAPIAREAAHAFGAPLVWVHDGCAPGRSLSVALDRGVPCLYVEGSGGGGLRGSEVDVYVGGILRIMRLLGLIADVPGAPGPARVLRGGDGNVDASIPAEHEGWCVTRARAGSVVEAGECVAEIVTDDGLIAQRVLAPHRALVMLLRRRADVRPGDLLAMFAPEPSP